ncbi:hypothetical protein J7384_18535 [Endozoicomonas sp. G2_1]|uniref:hypothetical protein n=1 Tax=Endozoicomonas sp. G2_1 TaxID=2821091 RepID=UPI001ADB30DB|nr:hypothetical protein [Endozoicomonas sp. G2_1]MBO9492366.1 hypothetical protein [Endozoicomonas sp. G2_1]
MISHYNSVFGKTKIVLVCCFATGLSLFYFSAFKNLELAIALGLAAIALLFDTVRLNKALNHFLSNKHHFTTIHSALESTLKDALKNRQLYQLIKNELFVIFYAFFAKNFPEEHTDNVNSFSYAKSSNARDIFWVVAVAQIPTLPFIHFIVEKEVNFLAAWFVSTLTIWSVIYYLAQVHAVRLRSIQLTETNLSYKFGLAWDAEISFADITLARKLNYTDTPNPFDFFISPLGTSKNIVIEFNQPIKFKGRYFITKKRSKAVISLDNPEAFLSQLADRGVSIT